jgi:hypothetical protein
MQSHVRDAVSRASCCVLVSAFLNCPGIEMFLISDGTLFHSLATLLVKKFLLNFKVTFLPKTFSVLALSRVTVAPVFFYSKIYFHKKKGQYT